MKKWFMTSIKHLFVTILTLLRFVLLFELASVIRWVTNNLSLMQIIQKFKLVLEENFDCNSWSLGTKPPDIQTYAL